MQQNINASVAVVSSRKTVGLQRINEKWSRQAVAITELDMNGHLLR